MELLGLRSPGLNSATPATEKARAQAMFWPGDRSCLDRQTPDGFPSLNVQLPDHVSLSTLQKTEDPGDDEDNKDIICINCKALLQTTTPPDTGVPGALGTIVKEAASTFFRSS